MQMERNPHRTVQRAARRTEYAIWTGDESCRTGERQCGKRLGDHDLTWFGVNLLGKVDAETAVGGPDFRTGRGNPLKCRGCEVQYVLPDCIHRRDLENNRSRRWQVRQV